MAAHTEAILRFNVVIIYILKDTLVSEKSDTIFSTMLCKNIKRINFLSCLIFLRQLGSCQARDAIDPPDAIIFSFQTFGLNINLIMIWRDVFCRMFDGTIYNLDVKSYFESRCYKKGRLFTSLKNTPFHRHLISLHRRCDMTAWKTHDDATRRAI